MIEIANNGICDSGLAKLVPLLSNHPSLITLDLSKCLLFSSLANSNLSSNSEEFITRLISECPSLKNLFIGSEIN
jgi:hypothetical protein